MAWEFTISRLKIVGVHACNSFSLRQSERPNQSHLLPVIFNFEKLMNIENFLVGKSWHGTNEAGEETADVDEVCLGKTLSAR